MMYRLAFFLQGKTHTDKASQNKKLFACMFFNRIKETLTTKKDLAQWYTSLKVKNRLKIPQTT